MTIGIIRAFGVTGFFSLLLWLGALAVIVSAWRRGEGRQRQARLLAAAGLALLALLPARSAAYRIAWMEVDHSEEVARAAAAAAAAESAASGPTVRFAEDTAEVKPPEPAYRQRGIQARSRAQLEAEAKPLREPETMESKVVTLLDETGQLVLRMPEKALRRAHRLDRGNRFGVAAVFWLALGLLVADYLRTFHSPTACSFPLPISGPLLDRLLSRPPVLRVPDGSLPALVETIIRRGETFVYCGPHADRVVPASRLPRWRWRSHACGWLPKLTAGEGGDDLEYLLDAVWFGRAFAVVPDREKADRLPAVLDEYLAVRRFTRARAAHTVNIIWDMDGTGDMPGLEGRMERSHELNFHWVLVEQAPSS